MRDIKAIMVGEAFSSKVGGFICGVIAFVFGVISFLTILPPGPGAGAIVIWLFFAITLGLMLFFLWRGRTVTVYVVTELQTVLWRSVARKWQADKLIAQLTPLINASQADLTRAQPTMAEQVSDAVDAAVEQTAMENQAAAQQSPMPELPAQPELPSQPELPQMQPRQTSDSQNPDGGPGAA
ncbi:hypothetical protein [Ereboglobus luteus]|uniref:hypothetical protein n=1 Tax=Ereboglobus luteus TaxID=1796921 RepID=UPI0012601881|nr:hypothetical protein [Ereboglobus luteus]